MRLKIGVVLASIAFAMLGFAGFAAPSYAATGSQWCPNSSNGCLNAWFGGPFVKTYQKGAANNDFGDQPSGSGGGTLLVFQGSGSYQFCTLGDYGNNSGDARAGLTCGSGIPWGGNLEELVDGTRGCAEFYSYHWSGYLYASSNSNGTQFYLNYHGLNPTCFYNYPPA